MLDIDIRVENIPDSLINLEINTDNNESTNDIDPGVTFVDHCQPKVVRNYNDRSNDIVENESDEEDDYPLDEHRVSSFETAYVPNVPHQHFANGNITIAPGEDRIPIPIICDENCEELAHPHLFPTGKFGYSHKRDIQLTPTKYFNQRLLNYSQKFASDSDYIFFAQSVLQHLNLNNQINIALQKVKADGINAGMLSSNFQERVKDFIAKDEGFNFMNTIKGTPAY